ncbi:uncharacterized protein LOC110746374 [Prunus avium]|uniref:Uncharacterized protein LOC110746374 n=1 Tax=Prunus avium TaxID=42229 RepID=A0A6P5RHP6_PRUAV|nr:uncharacterized protein LOC110746374 [Prunus avium]
MFNLRKKSDESLRYYIKRFKVFKTAEHYELWDDDRIIAKKTFKQVNQPSKQAGDPDKRNTNKYCAFHGTHGHYTNDCFVGKKNLEMLVREGYCMEFVGKQVIQQIEDRDVGKEPPWKDIRINTILADSREFGLTSKEKKRKIKQATMISQVFTCCPAIEDNPVISLQKKDLIGLDLPHNDALVISIQIVQAVIERLYVDEGNATNILQLSVVQ